MYSAEDLFTEEPDLETVREEEETENVQDDNEEAQNDDDEEERKVIKPKRTCNPQPKLNDRLLIGPKGLNIVKDYFKNVKYKGKGHEHEDLRTIMKIYEHWCHRLFPKYPFDDCIAKIENLGYKKTVRTHLKQIRMNMLQTDTPEEENEDDDHEEINTSNNVVTTPDAADDLQLTEDQIERIRLNKEHAKQLREERLRKIQEKIAANMENLQSTQNDSETVFTQPEAESTHTSDNQSELVEMETNENETEDNVSKFNEVNTVEKENAIEMNDEVLRSEDSSERQHELDETDKKCVEIEVNADEVSNVESEIVLVDNESTTKEIIVEKGTETEMDCE